MRMYDIIAKKRDGHELNTEEIQMFVNGYTHGEIPDYQASALLMAIFLKKMSIRETVDLTMAMMHSGDVMDLSSINGVKVDKHSTGGVGDTTTLILGPMVAACGVPVAKMSGRGLGHTGGTIDKLESIEGFHVELTQKDFLDQVNQHGIAVIGQSKNIAPADKKLYALRDVTATVDNISLIAASIMSKKLAAGSDAIVLDVKCGSGAFVKTIDGAIELASEMVNIGNNMNRDTMAVITDMDQPLGLAIGNALEVKEAIDTLNGKGPEDLTQLCIKLASYMVYLGKKASSIEEAEVLVKTNLDNKNALIKLKEFIAAQGGNVAQIDNPDLLPSCKTQYDVIAKEDGYVSRIQSDEVGISAMMLGAGREDMNSTLDFGAGMMLHKKIGDHVTAGDILATFHTDRVDQIENAEKRFRNALSFSKEPVTGPPLLFAVVSANGITRFDL